MVAISKQDILVTIVKAVKDTVFGSITIIVQDSCIIQMDKIEKVRFQQKPGAEKGPAVKAQPETEIKSRLLLALKGLEYGQVLLSVRDGNIIQLERTEKQRMKKWQGIDGEGI